jgi:5-methylcytosine-specific restriction endonuclease McrA
MMVFNKKEYNRKYHLKHKEFINKRSKIYRTKHTGEIREYNREYKKKYRATKHGKFTIRTYNRNRMRLLKGLSLGTVQCVYEDNIKKYGTLTCYLCLQPIQFGNDTLEHRIPISRGGSNLYENLGISCSKCNSEKGTKTEEEYVIRKLSKCKLED